MNIGQVMTQGVKTCRPQDSLNAAAKLMWDNNCGTVAVVADGKVVGMLTDRDICMAAYTQGRALKDMQVSGAMSKGLFACRPDDPLAVAEEAMRANHIRRLPVTDADDHLVGILSLDDIAREAACERMAKTRIEVTAEEVCDTLGAICEHSAHGALLTA
ncbi:MAG TPA: CBS domain-containing protein [Burkholderiales bacterium]|nr:CBS domain-containing protein [Burkholderiales bacterium]